MMELNPQLVRNGAMFLASYLISVPYGVSKGLGRMMVAL